VTCCQWGDDGGLCVSSGADGVIHVWDVEGGRSLRALANHEGAVHAVDWCPAAAASFDGTVGDLASAGQDGSVKLWRTGTGSCLLTMRDHGGSPVYTVAWTVDGGMLATSGGSGHIIVYNMTRIAAPGGMEAARIATKSAILMDIKPESSGNPMGHARAVRKVAWAPDSHHLLSAGDDDVVQVWNIPRGGSHVVTLSGHEGPVVDVAFDPDGTRAVTASQDGTARVWSWRTGECLRTFARRHVGGITAAAFSPEGHGRRVFTAGEDRSVCIWETATGLLLQQMEALHRGPITSLSVRDDGLLLLTGSTDRTLGVWRALPPSTCDAVSWAAYSWWITAGTRLQSCIAGRETFDPLVELAAIEAAEAAAAADAAADKAAGGPPASGEGSDAVGTSDSATPSPASPAPARSTSRGDIPSPRLRTHRRNRVAPIAGAGGGGTGLSAGSRFIAADAGAEIMRRAAGQGSGHSWRGKRVAPAPEPAAGVGGAAVVHVEPRRDV